MFKRILALFFLCFVITEIFSFVPIPSANIANAETSNVLEGVVKEDLHLTKENSPYSINTRIQVADGVSVTVDPGVEIKNGQIQLFGTAKLVAKGTDAEKIRLENVTINADNWSKAGVEIEHATLQKVNYYSFLSGALIVRDSEVHSSNFKLYEPSEASYLEGNLFTDNSALNITSTTSLALIKNNTFKNKNTVPDITYDYTNKTKQNVQIVGNNFLVTDKTVIRIEDVNSGDIINAQSNYWGTIDTKIIDSIIFDGNDDYNSNAFVQYDPYLTEFNTNAPVALMDQEDQADLPKDEEPKLPNVLEGIINKELHLTKENSPYSINERIQIADGVNVIVDPGVVVKNGQIQLFGTAKLVAKGTDAEKIRLENVTINADNWSKASVEIEHATLQKVNYYSFLSGALIVRDSEVHSSNFKLYEPSEASYLEGNLFTDNSALNITSTTSLALIKNNTFKNKNTVPDITYDYTNKTKQNVQIVGNNFLVTDKTVIRIEDVNSGDIINAQSNYWGTIDTKIIDSIIFDGNDDYNSNAFVQYEPYLTEFNIDAPKPIVQKPFVNEVTDQSTSITGTVEAGATVTIKAGNTLLGTVKTGSEGTFDISIPKQEVGITLSVTAIDEAGNISEATTLVVVKEIFYKQLETRINVHPYYNFTVKFNNELDKSTITSDNLYVKYGSNIIEGVAVSLNSDKKSVTVAAPAMGYKRGETYVIYVKQAVKSATGKELKLPVKMSFTVRKLPGT
ncbi:Ig-like domain-containing protein [Domibacillus sp. PGB-M46]|uniref:Ig-like domain-containing protein n=1 Tax=Domibacillus sp. PGB-M46 TaxID=2910255 RepID=UPI001F5696B0|nr:Ig-like domain-containing protein [Domibacillus sp. PGB-M46]MCI2257268.1 Ig-like domain-containing protein [Domibacillus sp. PGB-M46]